MLSPLCEIKLPIFAFNQKTVVAAKYTMFKLAIYTATSFSCWIFIACLLVIGLASVFVLILIKSRKHFQVNINTDLKHGTINEEICQEVIRIFTESLLYHHPTHDKFEQIGKEKMIEKIKYWMNENEPLKFCLPAFPAKSPNTSSKVFGIFPDYGEYLALKSLYNFACKISQIYDKGCVILLISDGRVYNDLVTVSKENVSKYHNCIQSIIDKNNWNKHIQITNLSQLIQDQNNELEPKPNEDDYNYNNTNHEVNQLATKLVLKYGIKRVDEKELLLHIKKLISDDNNMKQLYGSLSYFLEYDLAPWNKSDLLRNKHIDSITGIRKLCKKIAIKMICRSIAYTNLIKHKYSNYIRLSIHGHDTSNGKYGICFYKQEFGINTCITPWHNVVCQMLDGRVLLMKKQIVYYINNINQIGNYKNVAHANQEKIPFAIEFEQNDGNSCNWHKIDHLHHTKWLHTAKTFNQWSNNSKKQFELIHNCEYFTDETHAPWCFREK